MSKQIGFILMLSIFSMSWSFGQVVDPVQFNLTSGITLPIGESNDYYTIGGAVSGNINFKLPFIPVLSILGDLEYQYLPIWTGNNINIISARGGFGINPPLGKRLKSLFYTSAGYYYGILGETEENGYGNFTFSSGINLGFNLTPRIDLGADIRYSYLYDSSEGPLFQGIRFSAGIRYSVLLKKKLEIIEMNMLEIFPVLFKHYDNNSFGHIVISNNSSLPATDVVITFFVEGYMDNPTLCKRIPIIQSNTLEKVDLFALFSSNVLNITEGTKASAKIAIEYNHDGKTSTVEQSQTLRLYGRNATRWDDDRKAAAYVTAKDPLVLEYSKRVTNLISQISGRTLDLNLKKAIGIHEALRETGLSYVTDPQTPFKEFSENVLAIDYLQFPRETLAYKSGDCDDLTILYCALLESIGVETAFITVPGHIYMAFSLKTPVSEAGKMFSNMNDFIISDHDMMFLAEGSKVNLIYDRDEILLKFGPHIEQYPDKYNVRKRTLTFQTGRNRVYFSGI